VRNAEVNAERDEIEVLRAQVAALEAQIAETEAWANRAVAEAQEKTYWLDRWHVDLNKLMRRESADRLRAGARAIRAVVRRVRQLIGG
jgi:hypothetical protein